MIYTSYYARMRSIPKDIVPVAISLYRPDYYVGEACQILAPTPSILRQYKATHDEEQFTSEFYECVLHSLNPQYIEELLYSKSNGNDVVLLCYERSDKFCHRHLVADWFNANGITCTEFIPVF